jgi:IMP dehydrogenase
LNIPIVSAAMDTVTKSKMAIALAQQGGIGIIHRNMSIEAQADEVDKVKRHESGMIHDPISMRPQDKIFQAKEVMQKYRISGLPITDESNKLVGILTNRDIRFETRLNLAIEKAMTKELVTVPVGTSLADAEKLFHKHKIEKILIVDENHHLKGMITYKDILKRIQYPNAAKDSLGQLRVGAAIGVGDETLDRAKALIDVKVDVLVVDTAHGHHQNVLNTVKMLKKEFPGQEIIAGNIGTAEAAADLIELGVNALKVGVGPGSSASPRLRPSQTFIRSQKSRTSRSSPTAGSSSPATSPRPSPRAPARSCSGTFSLERTNRREKSSCTRAAHTRSTAVWARLKS